MLTRVPSTHGMSSMSHLALEVKEFDVKGSFGADPWGSPQDVESDERIREWIEGLRTDGGGGYVCAAYQGPFPVLSLISPLETFYYSESKNVRPGNNRTLLGNCRTSY